MNPQQSAMPSHIRELLANRTDTLAKTRFGAWAQHQLPPASQPIYPFQLNRSVTLPTSRWSQNDVLRTRFRRILSGEKKASIIPPNRGKTAFLQRRTTGMGAEVQGQQMPPSNCFKTGYLRAVSPEFSLSVSATPLVDQVGHHAHPAGLMTRAEALSAVSVEILVE